MANCFVFCGIGTDNRTYCTAVCANSPRWGATGQSGVSSQFAFAPYDGTTLLRNPWASASGTITLVRNQAEKTAALNAGILYGGDSCELCLNNPPPSVTKYDCINGACVTKITYNTPGIYNSLAECETACGTGCSGKCISNSEWSAIEGLANQLKQRNCS